jgi:hypothetical protein
LLALIGPSGNKVAICCTVDTNVECVQDSLAAALCTKLGGGELLNADEPQRLGGIDDGDAGMTAERQQMLAVS